MAFVGRGINTVRTVGDQTATGTKKFTGGVTLSGGVAFNKNDVLLYSNLTSSGNITSTGNVTLSGNKTFIGGYDDVILKPSKSTDTYIDLSYRGYTDGRLGYLRAFTDKHLAIGEFNYVTAPASDVNGSVVTTVSKTKAENGTFKFGNGMIVNFFSTNTNQSSGTTFTYKTPFTSATSYGIALCGTNAQQYYTANEKTATNIKIHSNASGARSFLAIGY